MQAYNAWMIEKDALKASGTIPNLENFTNFYEKMTNQQLDAIYIRKQLEDLNRSNDANSTPGERKQGGGTKDTPSKKRGQDRINLLTTTMHEEEKNEKSSPSGSKPFNPLTPVGSFMTHRKCQNQREGYWESKKILLAIWSLYVTSS